MIPPWNQQSPLVAPAEAAQAMAEQQQHQAMPAPQMQNPYALLGDAGVRGGYQGGPGQSYNAGQARDQVNQGAWNSDLLGSASFGLLSGGNAPASGWGSRIGSGIGMGLGLATGMPGLGVLGSAMGGTFDQRGRMTQAAQVLQDMYANEPQAGADIGGFQSPGVPVGGEPNPNLDAQTQSGQGSFYGDAFGYSDPNSGLYSHGGMVGAPMLPGNPPGPDDKIIGAQTGEGVLTKAAMKRYPGLLDAANAGKIKKGALRGLLAG